MTVKIALLPLYLRLYDEACPENLSQCEATAEKAVELLLYQDYRLPALPVF